MLVLPNSSCPAVPVAVPLSMVMFPELDVAPAALPDWMVTLALLVDAAVWSAVLTAAA